MLTTGKLDTHNDAYHNGSEISQLAVPVQENVKPHAQYGDNNESWNLYQKET